MLRFDFLISRDNLLMGRLFSGSVVRRAATQAPLTTFTEDEEVMRESGMTFAFSFELIVVARWAQETVAPKVLEMVYLTQYVL